MRKMSYRVWLFGEMLVFSIASLVASFVLSQNAIILAHDKDAVLSCSWNAVVNCANVGTSWQAYLFGFPNSFLGLICEPVVMTIAVLGLAKTEMPRWFLWTANVVYGLGFIFAYWMLWQSTFSIDSLCPWCLLVTLSTTFVFYSMTVWNMRESSSKKAHSFVEGGWATISLVIWISLVVCVELLHWFVFPA